MELSELVRTSLIQEKNPDAGAQNAVDHAAALKAGNQATPSVNPIGGKVAQPAGTPSQMFNAKSEAEGTCKQCPTAKGSHSRLLTAINGKGSADSGGAKGLSSIGPSLNRVSEAVLEAIGLGVGTYGLIRSLNKKNG